MDHPEESSLPTLLSTPIVTSGWASLDSGMGSQLPQLHPSDLGSQFGRNTASAASTYIGGVDPLDDISGFVEDATDASRTMAPPDLPLKQRLEATHTETFLRLERPSTVEDTPQFKYGKAEALKLDFKGRGKDAHAENCAPSQMPHPVHDGNKAAATYAVMADSGSPLLPNRGVIIDHNNQMSSDTRETQAARVHRDILQATGHELSGLNPATADTHYSPPVPTSNPRDDDTLERLPPPNIRQKRRSRHHRYREASLGSKSGTGFSQLAPRHTQVTPPQTLSTQNSRTRQQGNSSTPQQPPSTGPQSHSPRRFLDLQLDVTELPKHQPQFTTDSGRTRKTRNKSVREPRALSPEVTIISDNDEDDEDDAVTVASTIQDVLGEAGEGGSANGLRGNQLPQVQPPQRQSIINATRKENATHGTFHPSLQARVPALQDHTTPQGGQPLQACESVEDSGMRRRKTMSDRYRTSSAASHIRPTQIFNRQSPNEIRVEKTQSGRGNQIPCNTSEDPWAPARMMEAIRTLSECAQWNGGQLEAKDAEIRSRKAQIKSLNMNIQQLQEGIEVFRDENAEKKRQLESTTKQLEGYQIKCSGFRKVLDELASDGNTCKEELRTLTQRYEGVVSDKSKLESLCKEAKQSISGLASRIRDLERFSDEAGHEVLQLQSTVEILRRELDEKSGLLAAERDRTLRLETDSAVNNQRLEELKGLFTGGQQSILARLDEHVLLAKETGKNENLTLESLLKISDLIVTSSSEVSGLITSSSNECVTALDSAQAGKELLNDEIISLKTNAMLLEQQNLSLVESSATVEKKLHCSEEKVLGLEKEIVAMGSELRSSNEGLSVLQLEIARLSAIPPVDPEVLTELEELRTVNENLLVKLEEECRNVSAYKEGAEQAMGKLSLALEETQDLKNSIASFNEQKSEYEQQAKQIREDDRILFQKTAASVRQEELFQFERSIQQATNAVNKAEGKAARVTRQKQLAEESLFALEERVEALKKSEETANQNTSRMRVELAARDTEIANHQEKIKIWQESVSRAAELERRLIASERERDAAKAKALELENEIARLEEAHKTEVGAESQTRNKPQCNKASCPDGAVAHERQELHRTASSDNSSSSPAKVGDELSVYPSIRQTKTIVRNFKTPNTIERYSSPDDQLLEMEAFPMLEIQRPEPLMASFLKTGGCDNGSDSELSDIPESPREAAPRKEPQNSNTSKKKQTPPEATPTKPSVVIQNPSYKTTANPSSPIVPKSTRTYCKRQGDEDPRGPKSHGKKRAKLGDVATVVPDPHVSDNNKPVPPVRRQSGKSLQITILFPPP
ncbi:MAG: hypothetical protein M1840_005263 [Geoglossum simile]|nr:MAG: hypothetical protein M1840_005263 [Geoglossum simile]